ncbi:MAG: hypothetical protein Q7S06_01275 [Nanoarchaeota archaeon]|nr:hypothetical protein [Nanoarchaeota archaeon]
MSKQEIQFATPLTWITREVAHHKYKIGRSEWKRTGSSFHALFQKEKYRRYFA